MLPHKREEIEKSLGEIVPCSFVLGLVGFRKARFFEEGLENAKLMQCLLLLGQMLLDLLHLGLKLPFGLVLVPWHILDLCLKCHILRFNCATVFPFFQIQLVRESPP